MSSKALVFLFAVAGCANRNTQSPGDPCADFEVEVERTWSASLRAEVMNRGGEVEVEQRQAVVNKMDRISEDWVRTRTSVCKDHFVRGLITKEEYAARVRCFDDRLERQRTLAETLAGGGAITDVDGALDELLAQPESCEATP